MDRRQFLTTSSAVTAGLALTAKPSIAAPTTTAAATPGDAKLNALLEEIFQDRVRRNPTFATSLGLDKGPLAHLKSEMDTRPPAKARGEDLALAKATLAKVEAVNPATLSSSGKINRDVVIYQAKSGMIAPEKFGIDSVQRPYPIFQQGGAYFSTPDFLNSSHTIETAADAEAYLSRLELVDTLLDNDSAEQKAQAARGFLAPDWSLDLTLGQMRKLREPCRRRTAIWSHRSSAVPRPRALPATGRRARRRIVDGKVYPALDRQIALMEQAPPDDPARRRRLAADRAATRSMPPRLSRRRPPDFTPDEVHQIGLAQVAEITAQLDTILKAQGFTNGSVGERLAAAQRRRRPALSRHRRRPRRAARRPQRGREGDDDAGCRRRSRRCRPSRSKSVAVPAEIQDGASNGYYNSAALDGSRPAIYFINLKDLRRLAEIYACPR